MHFKSGVFIFLASTALLAGSAPAQAGEALPKATVQKVEVIAKSWVESGKSAGIAVGVARDGEILLTRSYGYTNLDDRVPVIRDSVFRVGSIQKQFTAAAVLLLVERGQLSLDDSLAKYFPDFPQGENVSIRQLLNHTSGIHNLSDGPDSEPQLRRQLRQDLTSEEVRELIKSSKPLYDFPPGTAFHYSNSGYMLAGMIVEKVSGQTLRAFLHDNVFSKQGLANTAVDNNEDIVPHRAQGYDLISGHPGDFRHAEFFSFAVGQWSGGLRTTVGDLLHWQHALLSGQVVNGKELKEMTSPAHLSDGRRTSEGVWPAGTKERGDYGFGFYFLELNGHKQIIHGGGIPGFGAVASTSIDDHLSFVVLTNTTGGLSFGSEPDVWIQIAMALLPTKDSKP